MNIVFSPRLKGVEKETLPTLPLSKERSLASYSSPEPEQVHWNQTPLWGLLPATGVTKGIWQSSTRTAVKPSWGHFGEYCKCTLQSTHIRGGPCVSPCYLHLETETGTETAHRTKSCGPVHTTADLLNDWYWYHTTQPDKAQIFRLVSRDIWLWTAGSLFCMQGTPKGICTGSWMGH